LDVKLLADLLIKQGREDEAIAVLEPVAATRSKLAASPSTKLLAGRGLEDEVWSGPRSPNGRSRS
jgi:hypothetical protein